VRRQVRQLSALLLLACARNPYTLDAGVDFVDVTTHGAFHLNPDYPVNFKADDGERFDVKSSMRTTPCAGEPELWCSAHMSVPDKAGVLAFSVCSKDVCNIEKVPLSRR
jgi:hypothetical protein